MHPYKTPLLLRVHFITVLIGLGAFTALSSPAPPPGTPLVMLLRALQESLVLFHKRIARVNRGEKTRISQCCYTTCNVVKRLNIFVEEN